MDAVEPEAIETKRKARSDAVIDGRTARRNRNKAAVLDALIELAHEGHEEPPIELIAERGGRLVPLGVPLLRRSNRAHVGRDPHA